MKFANLPRETKIILMDEQSALSKLRDKLEAVGKNINRITKITKSNVDVISEQHGVYLSFLFRYPNGKLSYFGIMIRVDDDDEINNIQHKMLGSMRAHLIAENYTPEF